MNRKVVAAVAIVIVAVVMAVAFMFLLTAQKKPVFKIIEHNDDLDIDWDKEFNPIYTVTVFIKVRNNGIDGTDTVVCEVTREDLSTIKKSKSLFLKSGQENTINFVFSHSELKGAIPKEYKGWVG